MDLTPQELAALRNVIIRAVNDCHDILAAAAKRGMIERGFVGKSLPSPDPTTRPALAPLEPRLAYSLKDAARALSISRTTLWRMVRNGQLDVRRIGHRTLVMAEAIRALLDRPTR